MLLGPGRRELDSPKLTLGAPVASEPAPGTEGGGERYIPWERPTWPEGAEGHGEPEVDPIEVLSCCLPDTKARGISDTPRRLGMGLPAAGMDDCAKDAAAKLEGGLHGAMIVLRLIGGAEVDVGAGVVVEN